MNKYHSVKASVFFCIVFNSAYAADYANEMDYFQEFPVVLSASRLSQPLSEAPNAMTVIDRKMIVASGARTIAELFRLVPGMYVSYYKGSQPFIAYHGSTDQYARRMQVMVDGRSIYMPPASTVDWASLPITVSDIERIEVIRGPAAASHGANSTQGVISIKTRDAGMTAGKSISFTRGEKGINDTTAHFGRRGDKLDYRMTLTYSADNGFDNLTTPPNGMPITQRKAVDLLNNSNDNNRMQLANFRADYHPNSVDRFDIQGGFNHDIQTVGWSDKNPNPAQPRNTNANPPHDQFTNSGFMQFEWIRILEDNAELSLRYYHIRQDQHEAFPIYLGGMYLPGPATQSVKSGRDEIELQHTVPFSVTNRLVYGAAWRQDKINARGYAQAFALIRMPTSYSYSSSTDEYRLFAHDEWRITPNLLLNAGGMWERDSFGNKNTSPRVALNFHLTPQHTLRTGVSVAYRTPAIGETRLYPLQIGALFVPGSIVSSPGLTPERLLSREIGYLGEFPDLSTSVDLRLFSDQVSNGIYASTIQPLINGMSAYYQGMEATLKHEFNEKSELTLNLTHELANCDIAALKKAGLTTTTPASPWIADVLSGSIPRNNASLLYTQRLSHDISFSSAFYYQDSLQPYDRGSLDYQPIQRRMDVRIAKGLNFGGGINGEMALVVQNLLNKKSTEYVAQNVYNRRSFATLSLNW